MDPRKTRGRTMTGDLHWCSTCDDFMQGGHPHNVPVRGVQPMVWGKGKRRRPTMARQETNLIETLADVQKYLTSFERECKEMVREAVDAGCTGKFSNNTHVILKNAAGGTMSIARKGNPANRGMQNMRSNFKRFLAQHELAKVVDTQPTYRPLPTDPTIMRTLSFKEALVDSELSTIASLFLDKHPNVQAEEMVIVVHGPDGIELIRQLKTEVGLGELRRSALAYECPVCQGREFCEVRALEKHIEEDGHVQCELLWEDGPHKGEACGKWLKNWRAKGPHRSIDHMGHKPWQHRDTWQAVHGQPEREAGGKGALVPESTKRRKKKEPTTVETLVKALVEPHVEDKKPAETPTQEALPMVAARDTARLDLIREILGEDPRMAEMTEELSVLRGELTKALEEGEANARRAVQAETELVELKARFDLAKEAFGL